jgi:hypothetical protein
MASESIEPDRPPVRAADADRERVVELLREHTTAGRLNMQEYEERVDSAYAAKTIADLRPLLADLPVRLDAVLPLETRHDLPPRWQGGPGTEVRPEQPNSGGSWMVPVVGVVVMLALIALAARGIFIFWPLLIGGFFIFGGGGRGHHRGHRRRY